MCLVFSREVDISSVARLSWCQGTAPVRECGGWFPNLWNHSTVPCNHKFQEVLQCWGIPGGPTGVNHEGQGWSELGEASLCNCGFVLLPIIVTARPHPPHLCILTPITGINQSVYLLFQFSEEQIPSQLFLGSTASFGRVRGGGQTPWLCFSACSGGCQTTAAAPLCSVSAPVTGFSSSMCWPLRQGCALYLSFFRSSESTHWKVISSLS